MAPKYRMFLVALLVSLALDLGTKIWARAHLRSSDRHANAAVVVIPGFFDLRYSENTGSAFGLFRNLPGAQYLLFVIGLVALFVVGSTLRKAPPDLLRVGAELGLLAGGALGNILDRLWFGYVTDFIVWKVGTHEWPTFNIADAALVIGVLGLFIDSRALEKAKAK